MSVAELERRSGEPNLVLVDCRWALGQPTKGRSDYADGHIPGSFFADLETDLSGSTGPGRHPLPDPTAFDITLGSWGVTPSCTVVAYDDAGGAIAARLWWMLTDQGHGDTHVLDGGYQAWLAGGHPVDTAQPPRMSPYPAGIASAPWGDAATMEDVVSAATSVVVDARSAERYRGDVEPVDARPGHIPGAKNLPFADNLDNGFFKDASTLRTHFASHGLTNETEAIFHCGSGVTACHSILAMEIAGLPRPRLYVGSWSEWAASDRPVATGETP